MSQLKDLMLDMEDDLRVGVVEAIEKNEKIVAKKKFLEKYPLAGPLFDVNWKKVELFC